ncbi:MAG: SoxR reducing system RseC family protein [Oscillospiraceae bacterium]
MTQVATVTKLLPGGMAEIAVRRESACGGNCRTCGGACSFKNLVKVNAANTITAGVGDRVVVSSSTSGVMTAAFIVYLLPLILFFIGYGITAAMQAAEKVSIIVSLAGFFAGVALAIPLNRWFKEKKVTTFEIVSVIQQ